MKDDYLDIAIDGMKINVAGSVLSAVPLKNLEDGMTIDNQPLRGSEGDLLLAKLSSGNKLRKIMMQNHGGRPVRVYPGDLILGVLGCRQSTTHIAGEVPAYPLGKESRIHLLSEGGILGTVTFIPAFMGEPVQLDVAGLVKYAGKTMNIRDFGAPEVQRCYLPPILLIAGTSSEIGKTTLATRIIHILSRKYGLKVCSVIMSGTGSKSEALEYRAAGAAFFHSFIEAGFCNSYSCPKETFLPALENLFYRIATDEKPDIIIGELGGDFVWGNNDAILRDSIIMEYVELVIVIPNDVLAAIGTIEVFNSWRVRTQRLFVNSWLRSYGGMSMRYRKILDEELLDPDDARQIDRILYHQVVRKLLFGHHGIKLCV